jgi:hypothetical protein
MNKALIAVLVLLCATYAAAASGGCNCVSAAGWEPWAALVIF